MGLAKNDEQVTVRLPKHVRGIAELKAEAQNRTLSSWIRQLVVREVGASESPVGEQKPDAIHKKIGDPSTREVTSRLKDKQ